MIILVGTALLALPAASRDGKSCGLLIALFTATSTTCVTGLALVDTWTQFSGFGQGVILMLIEVGGIGFMSVASMLVFFIRKKASFSQQLLMAQSIGTDDIGDVLRVQKRILYGAFLIQSCGAIILTIRFCQEYRFFTALKLGVFHAVSAFCNAGFDILGFKEPGTSICCYGTDAVICLTLSALIILGGLGFLVWDEVLRVSQPQKWSVYTNLVLLTTGLLIIGGMILLSVIEWQNPKTLGEMSLFEKLIAAFFQSVTTRTAGFAGISQGDLTEAGKGISIFLMLIGGSSGSTAGGLKTVTFIVLLLFLWSRVCGKEDACAFYRTISHKDILNALTIFGMMIVLSFAGTIFICACESVSFIDSLFEVVSAISTAGLSTGITASLSVPSKLLLIAFMYFGRVGLLTISLGFLRTRHSTDQFKYAETNLLIG